MAVLTAAAPSTGIDLNRLMGLDSLPKLEPEVAPAPATPSLLDQVIANTENATRVANTPVPPAAPASSTPFLDQIIANTENAAKPSSLSRVLPEAAPVVEGGFFSTVKGLASATSSGLWSGSKFLARGAVSLPGLVVQALVDPMTSQKTIDSAHIENHLFDIPSIDMVAKNPALQQLAKTNPNLQKLMQLRDKYLHHDNSDPTDSAQALADQMNQSPELLTQLRQIRAASMQSPSVSTPAASQNSAAVTATPAQPMVPTTPPTVAPTTTSQPVSSATAPTTPVLPSSPVSPSVPTSTGPVLPKLTTALTAGGVVLSHIPTTLPPGPPTPPAGHSGIGGGSGSSQAIPSPHAGLPLPFGHLPQKAVHRTTATQKPAASSESDLLNGYVLSKLPAASLRAQSMATTALTKSSPEAAIRIDHEMAWTQGQAPASHTTAPAPPANRAAMASPKHT